MHESMLISLKEVIEQRLLFNIPIYQRLYVWGADQIKVLLDDLVAACEADRDVFYLGGTLAIRQGQSTIGHPLLDLIDGQQRFTTLWLLSIALQQLVSQRGKHEKNHLAGYRFSMFGDQREPRIRFAIRPEVSRFFDALLSDRDVPDAPSANVLSHAIREMEGYFNDHPALCLSKLSLFIHDRVQLVLTTVPASTDLNKLFEVINNRGVQLQHHEILKARLLANISDSRQREIYGQLWDACSYMNDYVEKILRTVTGIKLVPLYDNTLAAQDREALAKPAQVRAQLEGLYRAREEQVSTLSDILENSTSIPEDSPNDDEEESYQSDDVRSIITFPMLLQHVLRIFLKRHYKADIDKILDKDLLQIFQNCWLDKFSSTPDNRADEIMEFIDLLWQCRYLFDKHVIKWVQDEDDEIHAIRRLRINSSRGYQSLIRDSGDTDTAFAMLQSMLYHSQQLTTHYWITPLLNYLLMEGGERVDLYLSFLDNYLLCSDSDDSLMQRTSAFLNQPWCDEFVLLNFSETLSEDKGTKFSHYWFYKLEYILWKKYRHQQGDSWQVFRMTAKNSVEHVSPQNPEDCDSNTVSKEVLDTFGNLALVSRSINSEYSNKPYVEKRARFRERNARKADSLKLALIYENEYWDDTRAKLHCAQMIADYLEYMNGIDKEVRELRMMELVLNV